MHGIALVVNLVKVVNLKRPFFKFRSCSIFISSPPPPRPVSMCARFCNAISLFNHGGRSSELKRFLAENLQFKTGFWWLLKEFLVIKDNKARNIWLLAAAYEAKDIFFGCTQHKSGVSRRRKEAKRKAKQRKEKRKGLCQAAVVESLTGKSAEEVILPLPDDMICLQNTDGIHPTVLVKGLDLLISYGRPICWCSQWNPNISN